MNIFDTLSDMKVFDSVEFPEFTEYYIKDMALVEDISKYLVWSHVSPSGKKIEWFTNNDDALYDIFQTIQNKSEKVDKDTYVFEKELSDVNFSKDARFFIFHKKNENYKARLAIIYHQTPDLIYVVFNVEDVIIKI